MSNNEAYASNISDVLPNPSADSVVYAGIVRGSHSADIGLYRVGGELFRLVQNFRHNASSAIIAYSGGVKGVLVTPTGDTYISTKDSEWVRTEEDSDKTVIAGIKQAEIHIDDAFSEMVERSELIPRGVVLPEFVLEIAARESMDQAA